MKGLQCPFTGRQLTDQELETLKRGRLPHNDFNLRLTITSLHSLDIGESQGSDAQDINPQTYFEDLVSTFTSDENLPRVGIVPDSLDGPISDTIPLYGLDGDGRPSLPKDTVSGEGYALALRVLPRMLYCNLCIRLQQEKSSILESKTTDDSQMERVSSLLIRYATFKRNQNAITKDLTAAEKSVLDAMMRRNFPSSSDISASDHDSASQPSEDVRDPESASQPRDHLHDLESSSSPRPQGTAKNLHKKALIPRTRMAISTIYNRIRGITSNNPVRADPEEDVTINDIELKEREFYKSQRRDRVARRLGMRNRLIAAVFGGLSLIVPMLIMAIHPSHVKTLVTSSVAVLLFAVGLAWKSTAKIETLLATTAAYAAVMVVFVGVNSN
ncbi:hypothetical protein XPA_003712 [Xanthoria parietina]